MFISGPNLPSKSEAAISKLKAKSGQQPFSVDKFLLEHSRDDLLSTVYDCFCITTEHSWAVTTENAWPVMLKTYITLQKMFADLGLR